MGHDDEGVGDRERGPDATGDRGDADEFVSPFDPAHALEEEERRVLGPETPSRPGTEGAEPAGGGAPRRSSFHLYPTLGIATGLALIVLLGLRVCDDDTPTDVSGDRDADASDQGELIGRGSDPDPPTDDSGANVDRPDADISEVEVRRDPVDGSLRVRIRVKGSAERALSGSFSDAVVVETSGPVGQRTFKTQVHDGVPEAGEIDPATGQVTAPADVEVDGSDVTFRLDIQAEDVVTVRAMAFNQPTPDGAVSSDEALVSLGATAP